MKEVVCIKSYPGDTNPPFTRCSLGMTYFVEKEMISSTPSVAGMKHYRVVNDNGSRDWIDSRYFEDVSLSVHKKLDYLL